MKNTATGIALLTALLAGLLLPGAHGQDDDLETAPIPDLNDVLLDTRRAIYLEVSLLEDGTATLLDIGITDVPPAATDEDPPMLMLQAFDENGQIVAEQNIWDPRYEYQETEDGETVVRLEEGIGLFQVPFDRGIVQIKLLDQQIDPVLELAVFDTQSVIQAFCTDNPENPNCADPAPTDTDDDGIPDAEDNCPETANPEQENADGDEAGDACDDDDDNDTVPDQSDQCPGTLSGEQVDSNGCSARQLDEDNDGVTDAMDRCPGTLIPESIPTVSLRTNRYALTTENTSDRLVFESSNSTAITIADTAGCSCEQIVASLALGKGHVKFGCSSSVLEFWIALVK